MTNPYKSSKICLHYGLARPTSIANTTSLLATPIDLTHPLQAMCIRQLHTCMHTTAVVLISIQTCGCRCNVRRGICSIKLKLFRSALGMGKIMRDPAPHVAHGRKTLQMCGAFDLKGFMLVLGNIIRPCQLRYMVSKIIPAFDLKGFMLVLGNIIRPCQQI